MKGKVLLGLSIVLLLALSAATAVTYAQATDGSIRGTVYKDLDANGVCVNTGEPVQPGTTVEFVSIDGSTTILLETGDDGTYGLAAAGLGTWQVTVKPGAGWLVTSELTRQVTITAADPLALGVDFCIAQITETTETTGAVVLPESGAAISPTLLIAGAMGLVFLAAGAILLHHGRRASG